MQGFAEYIEEFLKGTDEGVSPAERRKRNAAYLKKTMAKYRVARELGMKAADVNQRRNKPTLKKK
jgi:hypothetical protein